MNEKQENLNELLSGFYDEQETDEFKKDLDSFDQMLGGGPVPSSQTIDDIKAAVAEKLSSSRQRNRIFTFRRIAVAGIILAIALIEMSINRQQPEVTEVGATVATAGLFGDGEMSQIISLTEQIEEIEDALLSVRLDESDTNGSESYLELEAELSEINGDFWKG